MSRPRIRGPIESLRNTRKSMGDGTLRGRVEIATPYNSARLKSAASGSSGSSAIPLGEAIALSGTVTLVAGGDTLLDQMDVIDAQNGFDAVAAGAPLSLPATASWLIELDVRYTDGYRGGGTVVVTRNGTAINESWPIVRSWSRWVDQVAFAGNRQDTMDIEVTPADGASHDAEVTFRLTMIERLRPTLQVPGWTKIATLDGWGLLKFGGFWWVTTGGPGSGDEVVKYDTGWNEVSRFSTAYSIGGVRGIDTDGTDLWLGGGDSGNDDVRKYDTSGTQLLNWPTTDTGLTGVTWDGTNLWVCEANSNRIAKFDVTGTKLDQFATTHPTPQGIAYHNGVLYYVDNGSAAVYVVQTDGTVIDDSIPTDPMVDPRGMFIDDDGSLYVVDRASGGGIYRYGVKL